MSTFLSNSRVFEALPPSHPLTPPVAGPLLGPLLWVHSLPPSMSALILVMVHLSSCFSLPFWRQPHLHLEPRSLPVEPLIFSWPPSFPQYGFQQPLPTSISVPGLAQANLSQWVTLLPISSRTFRSAMARWLIWLGCPPVHQKLVGLVPSQGANGRQPICVSLSHGCFFLFLSISLSNQ